MAPDGSTPRVRDCSGGNAKPVSGYVPCVQAGFKKDLLFSFRHFLYEDRPRCLWSKAPLETSNPHYPTRFFLRIDTPTSSRKTCHNGK